MANIQYEPDSFTITDIVETHEKEFDEAIYSKIKGKSILALIDPAYVSNFLIDHYASFSLDSVATKPYRLFIDNRYLSCGIQFFNKSGDINHEGLKHHSAALSNFYLSLQRTQSKEIIEGSRLVFLMDTAGTVIECPVSTGLFIGFIKPELIKGKNLLDELCLLDLFSGLPVTLSSLQAKLKNTLCVLMRQSEGSDLALHLTISPIQYDRVVFYYLEFEVLSKSEQSFHKDFVFELFDTKIQQSVIVTDMGGEIQFWNQHATSLYGWQKKEVIGKNIMEVVPVEQSMQEAEEIMDSLRVGLSWSGVFLAKNKEGEYIQVQVHDSPIIDEVGNLIGIIGVSWDIAEHKNDRAALLLQQFFLNYPKEGFVAVDDKGYVFYINAYLKSKFPELTKLLLPIDINHLMHLLCKNQELSEFINSLLNTEVISLVAEFTYNSDTELTYRIKGKQVYGDKNDLAGALLFIEEIPETAQQTESLEKTALSGEALMNHIDDWIWSIDQNYCLVTANQSLLQNLQLVFGEKLQKGAFLLDERAYSKEYLAYWKDLYDKAFSGQTILEEISWPNLAGEFGQNYAVIVIKPVFNQNNEVIGCACYGRDTTKERKVTDQLKFSEHRFSTIFSAAPMGIAIIDSVTGKIDELNERFAEIAGRTIAELKQLDWMQITHPDDIEEAQQNIRLLTERVVSDCSMEKRYVRLDRTVVWVSMVIRSIHFEHYANPHHLCMIEDITTKKKAEERVRISNERYELAVLATNDMIWDWDIANDIVYRNSDHFVALTGLPVKFKDCAGEFWLGRVHEDDKHVITDVINRLRADINVHQFEVIYRFMISDGTYAFFNDRGYVIKDEHGIPVRLVGAVSDITEKIQRQEMLEKLSLIATKTNNAVIITDINGKTIWVNEAFIRNTGYQLEEVIGKMPGSILQGPDTDPDTKFFMSHRIRQKKAFECEVLNYHKNGTPYWIYLQVQPVFDEKNRVKYFFAIQSDITQSKKAQDELRKSEQKYRQLFDSSPVNIVIWDPITLLVEEVNAKAIDVYGIERDAFISSSYLLLHDESTKESIISLADQASTEETFYHYAVYTCRDKHGSSLFMQLSFHRIDYGGRMSVMAIGNNITEQVLLESALTDERRRKQDELTMAVLSAQDRERTNLGQELHDNVNQLLSVAKMYLSLSRKQDSQFGDHIQMVDNAITEAIADIRNISHELILPRFTEGDFGGFLDDLFKRFSSASKIPVELQFQDSTIQGVSESQLLAIYRILQEQLNNVIKYAKANTVFVDFKRRGQDLYIELKDDGVGFNMNSNRKSGVGFANMRTRASMNSGTINVDAAEGKGCTLQLHFVIKA